MRHGISGLQNTSKEANEFFMQCSEALLYRKTLLRAQMPRSLDNDDDLHDHLSVTALELSFRPDILCAIKSSRW